MKEQRRLVHSEKRATIDEAKLELTPEPQIEHGIVHSFSICRSSERPSSVEYASQRKGSGLGVNE